MKEAKFWKKPIYSFDEWCIVEEEFDIETNSIDETIFSLGNGYIGIRGNFEEGYQGLKGTSLEGTYLNGFYETEPINYGESAYGFPKYSQTMLNVTNSKVIKLFIEDEEFSIFRGELIKYKRYLDMKEGTLTREVIWKSPKGKEVLVKIKRIVCLDSKHLAAINYQVTPLNFSGDINIVSAIDGEVRNQETLDDPRVGSALNGQVLRLTDKKYNKGFGAVIQKTTNTEFSLICAMENQLNLDSGYEIEATPSEQRVEVKYKVKAKKNEKIELSKYITYYTTRDYEQTELLSHAEETLKKASIKGFDTLLEDQRRFLKDYWQNCDVEIKGDIFLQQGIRFNLFHLLQSVGRDGKTNIAAKGVTGEGYEGHYFWDTEIFILPFFLYTNPQISRKLLEYRYNILDKARQRAREMGHEKGALYPWRTIAGEECSAYFPAGTAQYHINADIIYAVKKYVEATGDIDFLVNLGAEMVFETARLWEDLGVYSVKKGNKFCINDVTGPDEYTAIVNNNFYTNIMAQLNLQYGYDVYELLKKAYPEVLDKLAKKINLAKEEPENWIRAAEQMYLPYDDELGIHPQDDSFLEKKIWDFENTPSDKYPLLLNFHPLVIYRHKVLKQADTVLALYLMGDRFTLEDKQRDYDYYEPITTHDSSLSTCIYSIMASEVGYYHKAYNYFMQTARMDLDNYQNNSQHGVHTAAMAGTWLGLVSGFGGMRIYGEKLVFNPHLPREWEGYRFRISFRDREIEVEVKGKDAIYKLLKGDAIELYHGEELVRLDKKEKVTLGLNKGFDI